jgi:hypothetical protein
MVEASEAGSAATEFTTTVTMTSTAAAVEKPPDDGSKLKTFLGVLRR